MANQDIAGRLAEALRNVVDNAFTIHGVSVGWSDELSDALASARELLYARAPEETPAPVVTLPTRWEPACPALICKNCGKYDAEHSAGMCPSVRP